MVVNKSKAAFRTIAEVAEDLGVATHVLLFWETKFPQIKPMKRSGGRFTIEGVQKLFKEKGVKALVGEEIQKDFFEAPLDCGALDEVTRGVISGLMSQLKEMKEELQAALNKAEK